FQEQVQLIGFLSKSAGGWPRVTPGLACLIIGANMGETRDPGDYERPIEREISAAVQEDHRRFLVGTRAGTVDMQLIPTQVNQFARRPDIVTVLPLPGSHCTCDYAEPDDGNQNPRSYGSHSRRSPVGCRQQQLIVSGFLVECQGVGKEICIGSRKG